ncbi:MMPL family transporter [Crocosphaera sp.]|uniref:MMPL family transporter n=1 Tax=Crocosphaera sp. TaxID=2729996 RepID=UPI002615FE5E|nr:MMPL family transporter [Crocosphaera sp.]MDJ0582245.1 MMPL family transporter [Crocosphaera sp.]
MKTSIPKKVSQSSIFVRLSRLTYHYRFIVIAIWGLLLLISLATAPHLDKVLQGVITTYDAGEALQAEQLLQKELSINSDFLTLVFESRDESPLSEHQTEIEKQLSQIHHLSTVKDNTIETKNPEYLSKDGRTGYNTIELTVKGTEVYSVISEIQKILTNDQNNNLKTYLTGKDVFDYEDHRISEKDLVRAEVLALPLTLIALLFVFGSVVAATLPVAMAIMTVSISSGLLYLLALQMEISIFALNLTTMLGLGIGIDFTLVMVSRFREELTKGSIEQAVIQTVDTAGRAVFFSGLTTCIGLVCLMLFPISLLQSLGVAGAVVVFLSIAAALTLVPALLSVLGFSINRWCIINPRHGSQGFWGSFARRVIRHSILATVLVLMVVTVMISPFFDARWGLGGIKTLPSDVEARQGVEVLEKAFGVGETAPILVAIRSTNPNAPILSEDNIAILYNLVETWQSDARVAEVRSLFNIRPQLDVKDYQRLYKNLELLPAPFVDKIKQFSNESTTVISIKSKTDSNAPTSFELVKDLQNFNHEGLQILVGGQISRSLDTINIVMNRFPLVLATMMIVTFIALTILFQSVILPIKAIFLNLMSISASFGALIFVFQQGNFKSFLNFTPVGYIDILLPIVMFCILFGLSMDYEVFLLTRMKEAYDKTGNNHGSIVEGLEKTGRIITSAALLMFIVTGAFAFSDLIFIKALGLGIAISVVLDSTLIRAVLVPASMKLMGKWNWWAPEFLRLKRIQWRLD